MTIPPRARRAGFGLVELMLAMAMTSVLVVALVQLALASTGAFRLQHDLGALSHDARFAFDLLRQEIAAAGYEPEPWRLESRMAALGADTLDGGGADDDRLELRRRSQRNCFGHRNPALDAQGRPRHDLRISRFRVSASGNLAWTCHYGPGEDALVRQVNGLGLIEHVEALRLRFAEDVDGDGNAGRWVRAGGWSDERKVVAVRVGLVLAGGRVDGQPSSPASLLGDPLTFPDDGRLRKAWVFTTALRGRLR